MTGISSQENLAEVIVAMDRGEVEAYLMKVDEDILNGAEDAYTLKNEPLSIVGKTRDGFVVYLAYGNPQLYHHAAAEVLRAWITQRIVRHQEELNSRQFCMSAIANETDRQAIPILEEKLKRDRRLLEQLG